MGSGAQPGHHAIASPARKRLDLPITVGKERRIAAKLVDEKTPDHRRVVRVQYRPRANERSNDAAAIDIADQHDWHTGSTGKAHVGDVACPQVDLRRRAGAFNHDDIALRLQPVPAFHDLGQQFATLVPEIATAQRAADLAVNDQLRCVVGLRLEQYRVHVGVRFDPAC